MYRKLWLKNNKGDTFTFTEKNSKAFLNNPNGFGFGKTLTTYNLGNVSKVIGKEINFQTWRGLRDGRQGEGEGHPDLRGQRLAVPLPKDGARP